MILRFLLTFITLLCFSNIAIAEEVIENFVTEIQIQQSGDILVSETITVHAEGNKIRRGIYRDLPKYRDGAEGGRLKVKYDILSITRDGRPENYFKERHTHYTRYYLGREDYFLPTGRSYTYEINYRVPKQVFYFDEFDELYWNMTGNDWDFPIERAKAIIKPPPGLNIQDYVVYVGYAGETGSEYTQAGFNGKDLHVDVTRVLQEREGLSVAATFPKGFFDYPSKLELLLQKFSGLIILLSGLGICGVYYNHVWQRYGKDPRSRGLAPFYDAPKGISPAIAHFIMKMGSVSSKELLTITIVSLAAKGYLTIEQDEKKKFIITKTDKRLDGDFSPEEKIAYEGLKDVTKVKPHNSKLIKLVYKVKEAVRKQGEDGYYKLNTTKWFLGLIPYIATLGLLFWNGNITAELLIIMTILSSVALAFYAIVAALFRRLHDIKSIVSARVIVNILALFYIVGGSVPAIFIFIKETDMSVGIIIYSFVSMLFFAMMFHLMKAPTVKGQEIMDHLRGLKLYMEKVEQPILEKFDPPEMSRELFEKYLPYAVALGVEGKWSEAFAKHAESAMSEEASSSDISPNWYTGPSSGFSSGKAFTTAALVGGLGAALSIASATRSSSSSGGSGSSGGSSGGGGGGGGGGGW